MTELEQVIEKCKSEVDRYEWDNTDQVKSYFSKLLVPNILYSANMEEKNVDCLTSRVGGKPMVPPGFEWPVVDYGEKPPLAFFFQLNLAEVSQYDTRNILPKEGMLSCFVGQTDSAMHEPDCISGRQLFYFKDISELSEMEPHGALPEEQKLEAKKIEFHNSYEAAFGDEYPDKLDELEESLGELSEDDMDGIWDVKLDIFNEGIHKGWKYAGSGKCMFSFNRILGSYETNVVDDWCEMEDKEEEDFRCLLAMRFDIHDGFAFDYSDADMYFCLSKDDLESGKLENIKVFVKNS